MADQSIPQVSVLMTLYNKGPYVEDAVRSVLASTFTDLELLVVDDGSTDEGPQVVEAIDDPRLQMLRAERNTGRPAAANRGYDAARGEFVAVLDADDVMFPERLERQVAFLREHPEVGAVGSSLLVPGARDELWSWARDDEEARGLMLFGDPICYGTAMFRRSVLEEHHLRCNERWLRPGMDYLFIFSLAPHLRYANIAEPLTFYRFAEQNMRFGRDPVDDRAAIYAEQFRMLGLEVSPEEIDLQLLLHRLFRNPPDSNAMRGLHQWVARLKRLNRERELFPRRIFEAEIDRRMRRLFHPIADVDPKAAALHMRLLGEKSLGHLRYLAVRMLKGAQGPQAALSEAAHKPALMAPARKALPPSVMPRITLVTPSLQQCGYLKDCFRSVHDQRYPALEHIVIDGGSTDGSVELIQEHADELAWWISAPDKGQSDAITRGGVRGTGSVFGWLNSDDELMPGALQQVGQVFASDPSVLVVSGARILRFPDGDRPSHADDPDDTESWFTAPRVNQQSTFIRMDVMRRLGFLERKLHYVMDYELWLQLMFRYGTDAVRTIPEPLSVFRYHEASKTMNVPHRFTDEMASVLHGLCVTTKQYDLIAVLETGHRITKGLRRIPLADPPAERERVRRMVVSFLLRWHYTIFHQEEFRMMRLFRRTVRFDAAWLNKEQRERLAFIDEQLRSGNWTAFRLRRKWQHLAR